MGYNDLFDMFKIVSSYRSMLKSLEKRYSLVEVLKYLIENDDLIKLDMNSLYEKVKIFIEEKDYNILSKTITDEKNTVICTDKRWIRRINY